MATNTETELKFMKERIRRLERRSRKSSVVFERHLRKSSVVFVDDEQAIDGSCSRPCTEYFVELVTIPGAKSLVIAKHALTRALWIVTFVIGFGLTVYYVWQTVETYVNEPTATKVKLTRLQNYTYPNMLLCPDTWLDLPKALASGATVPALQYALGFLINYYMRPPPYRIVDYPEAKKEFEDWYRKRNFTSLVQLFTEIALDSESFVYKCPNCRKTKFTKVLMDESVCYKIPMSAIKGKGTARGTMDILEVKIPDRSGGLLSRKKYWRFYVNPDLAVGVSTVQFSQVFPGYSNTVRFTPVRFTMISKPTDLCRPVDENDVDAYSRIECALACLNKRTRCTYLGDLRQTTAPRNLKSLCHYYSMYYWFLLKTIKPQQNLVDLIPSTCFEKCPPRCKIWMYETSVESHEVSGQNKSSASTLLTRFYFSNQAPLQYGFMFFQEVNTFSFESLVGNIGGDLSLWLGVSIISVIQMFVFFLSWGFARYWNKAKKWKRHQDVNEDEIWNDAAV